MARPRAGTIGATDGIARRRFLFIRRSSRRRRRTLWRHGAHWTSSGQSTWRQRIGILDYAQLARDYGEVYQKYPDTLAGEEAFLYQIRLSLPTADADRARKNLGDIKAFLQSHPKTPFLSPLYTLMAESCHKMNEEDERLDYMIKAVQTREVDPTTPFFELSTAYWNIAYAAEFEAGDFAIAREYYHRLMAEFPREIRVFAARKALARMDAVEAALREGRTPPSEYLGGALQ